MHEIVDNIYVFSTGRLKFGEIIASRTRDKLSGGDLFSELTLSRKEGKFLSDEWVRGEHRIMAAHGTRGGKDAPIILINNFCGVEILGLVVEILSDEPRVLRGEMMQCEAVAASERILELLEEGFANIDAERRIGEFLNSAYDAENLKDLARYGIASMYEGIETISRLVGVRIEVHQTVQGSVGFAGVRGYRVAANELFAIITILALAARENAPDRTLYVDIDRCDEAVTLSVSFETGGEDFDALCEHIHYIADGVNMIYSTSVAEGKLRCDLWPYVIDVSLIGLKNPDDLLLARFYEGNGLGE